MLIFQFIIYTTKHFFLLHKFLPFLRTISVVVSFRAEPIPSILVCNGSIRLLENRKTGTPGQSYQHHLEPGRNRISQLPDIRTSPGVAVEVPRVRAWSRKLFPTRGTNNFALLVKKKIIKNLKVRFFSIFYSKKYSQPF